MMTMLKFFFHIIKIVLLIVFSIQIYAREVIRRTMYMLRGLIERYENLRDPHMVFIHAYDWVPRKFM